jgi:hypothetical protein
VQPVLATATEPVGTLSNEVAGPSAPAETSVQPVLTTATDPASTLSNDTDLVQPSVPDTSTDQAPAETLLALATATDPPIEVPESATMAPTNVVTDASNSAGAADPTSAAGDVIALNDAPPPPTNALFTETQYTDYGVTLSSEIAVPPQEAVSADEDASAQDILVPVATDVQQPAPPAPEMVDTTSSIDHLGLRDAVL